jgi:5-methylcytosine-specific restriction endonuclease McrA
MAADPKPKARRRDPDLMRLMHADARKQCALTGAIDNLEIHHVLPRAQGGDDTRANLVWLRRDVHQRITSNDQAAMRLLGDHVLQQRVDTVRYLIDKLGVVAADDWMRRRLLIGEP